MTTHLTGLDLLTSDGEEGTLGRPPRPFREFARTAAAAGAWSAPA